MRHRKKIKKLSRPAFQRKALIESLLRALLIYERITTTEAKAKAMRSWADKLISLAKEDTLHHRRLSFNILKDHRLVKRLFEVIGPRFKDVNGGYSRVIDLSYRKGDGAKLSILELTKREKMTLKSKKKAGRKEKPVKDKKASSPKEDFKKKGFMKGIKGIFKKDKNAFLEQK